MKALKYRYAAILALCAVGAWAQEPPAGPVKLELNLKAGQARTFQVASETSFATTMPGAGTKTTTTKSGGTFELVVDAVNPDGSYTVKVRTLKQILTVNNSDVSIPDGSDAEVKAKLGRDGRFSEVTGAPKSQEGPSSPMTGEDFLNTVFDKEASLPDKPLAIGDTWKDKVQSPVDEAQPKLTVNCKLVGVDMMDTFPVARVLRVINEPLQDGASEPGISMTGKMEGGGLATVELSTGLVLDERDTLRLTMTIDAQNPADASEKVNIGTVANIKVRVQSAPSVAS